MTAHPPLRTLLDIVARGEAGIRSDRLDEAARTTSRQEADRILRAAGYRRLGKGAFAAVYQKAGKYVGGELILVLSPPSK